MMLNSIINWLLNPFSIFVMVVAIISLIILDVKKLGWESAYHNYTHDSKEREESQKANFEKRQNQIKKEKEDLGRMLIGTKTKLQAEIDKRKSSKDYKRVKKLEKELNALKEERDGLLEDIRDRENRLEDIDKDKLDLIDVNENLKEKIDGLERKIDSLENEKSDLEEEIDNQKETIADNNREIDELFEEMNRYIPDRYVEINAPYIWKHRNEIIKISQDIDVFNPKKIDDGMEIFDNGNKYPTALMDKVRESLKNVEREAPSYYGDKEYWNKERLARLRDKDLSWNEIEEKTGIHRSTIRYRLGK